MSSPTQTASVTMQAGGEPKPDNFDLRLRLLYCTLFLPNAIYLSFFPLWLEARGLGPVQISTALTLPVFVRIFVTPLVTYHADRSPERANVLIALAFGGLAACAALLFPVGYYPLLVLIMVLSAFWSPQVPVADSITLSGVRRYGIDYASFRSWGSILFLLVNVVAGWVIERTSAQWAVPMMIGGYAMIVLGALAAPRLGRMRRPAAQLQLNPSLFKSRAILLILIATGLIQASHALNYNFGSIYMKSLGMNAEQVGLLWAVPVFGEIIMFRVYARLFGSWSGRRILALSGAVSALRWGLLAAAPILGLGFAGLALVQVLHAFSFGATYLAQQHFLANAVPEDRQGAAQGLGVFVHGIIMAAVMLASGPLYKAFQGYGFLMMIVVVAAGVVVGFLFEAEASRPADQPQSAGSGG